MRRTEGDWRRIEGTRVWDLAARVHDFAIVRAPVERFATMARARTHCVFAGLAVQDAEARPAAWPPRISVSLQRSVTRERGGRRGRRGSVKSEVVGGGPAVLRRVVRRGGVGKRALSTSKLTSEADATSVSSSCCSRVRRRPGTRSRPRFPVRADVRKCHAGQVVAL